MPDGPPAHPLPGFRPVRQDHEAAKPGKRHGRERQAQAYMVEYIKTISAEQHQQSTRICPSVPSESDENSSIIEKTWSVLSSFMKTEHDKFST